MQDCDKTKLQLLNELAALRQRVAELETPATEPQSPGDLQASETRYRRLFEAAQDGILILDAETGQITDVNPFLTNLLGYAHADLVGKTLWEIGPVRNIAASREAFAELQSQAYIRYEDLPLETYSGQRIDVEFVSNIYLAGGKNVIQCNIRDITARKYAEKQLQQYTDQLENRVVEKVRELELERAKSIHLDRMAALGQLATGMAHELNQPLTAITYEAEYLRLVADKILPDAATLRKIGADLLEDVLRCRRIVDHLRTFGRTHSEPSPISLEQPINDSLNLTAPRMRELGVVVRVDFMFDLPFVLADTHKLEQVFLNLIANAEYALNANGKTGQKLVEITTFATDGYVIATVRDNGCGIPKAVQKHIFEPFFTTKPANSGTGLGLAISQDIVAEFGGEISYTSAENTGTTFTLRFPAYAPEF